MQVGVGINPDGAESGCGVGHAESGEGTCGGGVVAGEDDGEGFALAEEGAEGIDDMFVNAEYAVDVFGVGVGGA